MQLRSRSFFFFFNDTATTEIYTLSLHDALPICIVCAFARLGGRPVGIVANQRQRVQSKSAGLQMPGDRKSTRLNSSHQIISYAVFCLKKKNIHYSITSCQPSSNPPSEQPIACTH